MGVEYALSPAGIGNLAHSLFLALQAWCRREVDVRSTLKVASGKKVIRKDGGLCEMYIFKTSLFNYVR